MTMRLKAYAERKAAVFFAVDAAHIQHLRVDHARAQHFDPARAFADAAALAVAVDAGKIDLSGRLGEQGKKLGRKRVVTSSP